MHTIIRLPIDHATCPPDKHRTTFNRDLGEDGDPATGQMQCLTCTRPMLRCDVAHRANNRSDNDGYQQQYVHVDAKDGAACPAEHFPVEH